MADHRDVAGHYRSVLTDVNTRTMTATFTVWTRDEEGDEEIEHTVPLRFELCDTCEGRGSHVNPSIDAGGLSREDFDEDPDFAEDYRSGRYDVACSECRGARVVPVVDEMRTPADVFQAYQDAEAAAWADARETAHQREMGY